MARSTVGFSPTDNSAASGLLMIVCVLCVMEWIFVCVCDSGSCGGRVVDLHDHRSGDGNESGWFWQWRRTVRSELLCSGNQTAGRPMVAFLCLRWVDGSRASPSSSRIFEIRLRMASLKLHSVQAGCRPRGPRFDRLMMTVAWRCCTGAHFPAKILPMRLSDYGGELICQKVRLAFSLLTHSLTHSLADDGN